MEQKDLIAPQSYNFAEEIRRFATGEDRTALIYEADEGNKNTITYDALV